jgi:excisionase family DNA binding protein
MHRRTIGRVMHAEVVQEWVTYKQAGKISGLSRTTLRKLAGEGSIKVRHIGRAVRINRESLDRYMNAETGE